MLRVGVSLRYRQVFILLLTFFLFSCVRNTEEIPLIPPATNPMAREFIGYGVVNVSFLHVLDEPLNEGASLGYLRRRAPVRIMERRSIRNHGNVETWVKIDAESNIQGWIIESSINVYDNEVQAHTAAQNMSP